MDAATLFENTMDWLRDAYGEHRFFVERDIVWTAQLCLLQEVEQANLPYRVLNDYTLFRGTRADLAILNGGAVEVAAEFKYEPSHARSGEFGPGKFPVVAWTGEGSVAKDVQRVHDYAAQGNAKTAYAVFIDEGGEFRHRDPHPGSEWRDWGNGVSALWTKGDSEVAYKTNPAGATDGEASSRESHETAAHGEWVPLLDLNVKLSPYAPPPACLRFPDGNERPVKFWKDLPFRVAEWLAARRKIANGRVANGSKRDIVNETGIHPGGADFDEPQRIADTDFFVETKVDKEEAKSQAIKLLKHCDVVPSSVRVLR